MIRELDNRILFPSSMYGFYDDALPVTAYFRCCRRYSILHNDFYPEEYYKRHFVNILRKAIPTCIAYQFTRLNVLYHFT